MWSVEWEGSSLRGRRGGRGRRGDRGQGVKVYLDHLDDLDTLDDLCTSSPPQLRQMLVAHAERLERIRGVVVLHEGVADAGGLTPREDRREVDRPLADVDHAVLGRTGGILDVHELHATRIAREVRERIGARLRRPVQIQLESDERGIGALEHYVERDGPVDSDKLEIVVVVAELHPGGAHLFADAIQLLRDAAVVVE